MTHGKSTFINLFLVCLTGVAIIGCKPSPKAGAEKEPAKSVVSSTDRELAQPENAKEKENQCISMSRALDLALQVTMRDGVVAGLRDSSLVDNMMLAMGYGKSLFTHMQLNGGVRYYTNGCDVDETGAMVAVRSEKANVVRISTKGQPQGSELVTIAFKSRRVYDDMLDQLADLGFKGAEPELTDGQNFKVFVDKFISGEGYCIQISRLR